MTTLWKGSLGGIAERLRRSLAWTSAGGLNVEFSGSPINLQPVVIADDATRPGGGGPRNRRWMTWARFEDVPIGDTFWMGIATEGFLTGNVNSSTGVIVDRIDIACEGQHNPTVVIIPPGGALPQFIVDAVVANTRVPIFVDGMKTVNDWAPLWQGETAASDAGAPWGGRYVYGVGVGDQAGVIPGSVLQIPTEIYLQPGSCLIVGPNIAQIDEMDWQVSILGRSY